MYQIMSNDGDTWEVTVPDEAGSVIAKLLEDAAVEQQTREWCSFEVYWIGPDRRTPAQRLKDDGLI